jgi:hypothetical protein
MRIADGNIFEAMRLVLPEHRELMEERRTLAQKRKQPMLSEDEWARMEYVVTECLEEASALKVTLFQPWRDIVLEGTPILVQDRLCLQTDQGVRELPIGKIVAIEKS